jgi:hypothetical protein
MAQFQKRQLSGVHYLANFAPLKNRAMRRASFVYRAAYLQQVQRMIREAGGKRVPRRGH